MPPINTPDLLKPRPEPEALEPSPEQRFRCHAQDKVPDLSSTRERGVSSHRLHEVRPKAEKQGRDGKRQHSYHHEMYEP